MLDPKVKDYSFPIDVFSLSVLIYYVCNFTMPHRDKIFELPADYSKELQDLIEKCHSENPVDRPILAGLLLNPLLEDKVTLRRYKVKDLSHAERRGGAKLYFNYDAFEFDKTIAGKREYVKSKV